MGNYVNATRHPIVLADGRVVPTGEGFEAEADAAKAYLDSGEAIEVKGQPETERTSNRTKERK
jgi:hypothetical protein